MRAAAARPAQVKVVFTDEASFSPPTQQRKAVGPPGPAATAGAAAHHQRPGAAAGGPTGRGQWSGAGLGLPTPHRGPLGCLLAPTQRPVPGGRADLRCDGQLAGTSARHRAPAPGRHKAGCRCSSLPTYAPWLNNIEKLWKWLRQRVTHAHPWAADFATFREHLLAECAALGAGSAALRAYCGLNKVFS